MARTGPAGPDALDLDDDLADLGGVGADDDPGRPGTRPSRWRDPRPAWLPPWLPTDARLVGWVVTVGVAALVSWWLLRPAPTPFEEAIPRAAITEPTPPDPSTAGAAGAGSTTVPSVDAEVVAHAAGAVVHPGVYRLAGGSRVDDLVRAAGGLAGDADARRLNLAAPVADGSRLYVPKVGEAEPPEVVGPDGAAPPTTGAGGTSGAGPGSPSGLIDLNRADEAALEELPGVGPATAAAIVTFREENGPFASIDELLDVPGIGEAKLEQIRPRATV